MTKWPDLTFPPINLLVLPKHEVLLDHISKIYAEHYGDLWDQKAFDYRVNDGRIKIMIQGEVNE